MSKVYTGVGTLSDGKIVVLDHPLCLSPGRVRVLLEPLSGEQAEGDWLTKLKEIRQSLRESGYQSRDKEEIDAQIRSERESWGC